MDTAVDRFIQFRSKAKWWTLIFAVGLFVTDWLYHTLYIRTKEGRVAIESPPLFHLLWLILFFATIALAFITALKWQSVVAWIVIFRVVWMKVTL